MTGEFAIAVHALVFIERHEGAISSARLAESVCTNPARVRKVMSKLKKAGLVAAEQRNDGGYLLAREAAGVTLAEIAAALGESMIGPVWHSGDVDMDCEVASGMAEVIEGIRARLNGECARVLASITLADVGDMLDARSAKQGS